MNNQVEWTTSAKIAFRITFIFSLLFILIQNNNAFPLLNRILLPLHKGLHDFIPWFSQNILQYRYDYSITTNGSGDTSYDWIILLLIIIVALLGAILWSILERKRENYNTAYYWMTVCIRYYLAMMLFFYGIIKLVHAQMPPPSLSTLMMPLHEMSPMSLAWTYFGYSKGFNIFVGCVEIASVLLLFRKTMVLGALITLATGINIMSVNYFYDVPVKIVSTIIVIFSIILLAPNLKSFWNYFILGRSTQLKKSMRPLSRKKWLNTCTHYAKYMIITIFLMLHAFILWNRMRAIEVLNNKSPLYGIYKIERITTNPKALPTEWVYIIFESRELFFVRDTSYERTLHEKKLDENKKQITIAQHTFDYVVEENGNIILNRLINNEKESYKLIRMDENKTRLLNREFKFIQEQPHG